MPSILHKIACLMATIILTGPSPAVGVEIYDGLCDASAGFAIGPEHFVVVGDERNVLTLYKAGQRNWVREIDLSNFLNTKPKKESDLEGAAAINNHVYIISSHGRNLHGEMQERRHRFFAVEITPQTLTVRTIGKPYAKLLDDLLATPGLKPLNLANAASLRPEEPGGLNIEGLAATKDGSLLIGFRNPLVEGKALVVPLLNPREVVDGKSARIGEPVLLNLGGRGIRSLERVGDEYLIVAGPVADNGTFALFRWSGREGQPPLAWNSDPLAELRPEGLFAVPGTSQVRILSDDGGIPQNGVECKSLPQSKQSFRSITITP
nr:DUF3616 domain-containing protein [uncultured Cupriavidus sp.]